MAQAYSGVIQSAHFTQQEFDGMRVLSGSASCKGESAPSALIFSGADAFILVVSGSGAEQRLAQTIGTLRRVRGVEGDVQPSRIRVRKVASSGSFEVVSGQTCGSSLEVAALAVLNGRAKTDRVAAGDRIKCVEQPAR